MAMCLKLVCVLIVSVLAQCYADKCNGSSCQHGARVVREALEQYGPAGSADVMNLVDGIEVVEVVPLGEARANGGGSPSPNEPLLSRLARFLESHELKIKLNNLMPGSQVREFLTETYKDIEQDKTLGGEIIV